jgi:hypothetical protein
MLLRIVEDFTTSGVTFDSELTTNTSGSLPLNSGVHPSITLQNLISFLPDISITFDAYDNTTAYGVYENTRSKSDIVNDGGTIYQCIQANTGEPTSDSSFWLETNIDSLRLKNLIYQVKDRVITELNLQKRLVDNQYLYGSGELTNLNPTGDYFGWALEPKNTDYVRLTINQMAIRNTIAGSVNVYVVNQGELIDTLSVVGGDGKLSFKELNYSFYGKGIFYFLVDSSEVMLQSEAFVDILRYDGFTAYTVTAQGTGFDNLDYTINQQDNGIGLNVTAFLDSSVYVENNLQYLAKFVRCTFELMTFEMFLNNSNTRSNVEQREQHRKMYITELKDTKNDTVVSRFYKERDKAYRSIERTFDSHLSDDDNSLTVRSYSV